MSLNPAQEALLNEAKKALVEGKSAYEILDVSTQADAKEIKSAYKRLARSFHPDIVSQKGINKDSDDAEIKAAAETIESGFKMVTQAYEALDESKEHPHPRDKNKKTTLRAVYDEFHERFGWDCIDSEFTVSGGDSSSSRENLKEKNGWGKSDHYAGDFVRSRGRRRGRGRGIFNADEGNQQQRSEPEVEETPVQEEPQNVPEPETSNEIFEIDSQLMATFTKLAREAGDVKTLKVIKGLTPKTPGA